MEDVERKGLQPDEIIEWCMADGIARALTEGEVMSSDEAAEIEDKIRQDRVEQVRKVLGTVAADKHQLLQRELASCSALSKRINSFTYGHKSKNAVPGYDAAVDLPHFSIPTPNKNEKNLRLADEARRELRSEFESLVPEASIQIIGRITKKMYSGPHSIDRLTLEGFETTHQGTTYDGQRVDSGRYAQWEQELGDKTSKTFLTLLVRMTEGQ